MMPVIQVKASRLLMRFLVLRASQHPLVFSMNVWQNWFWYDILFCTIVVVLLTTRVDKCGMTMTFKFEGSCKWNETAIITAIIGFTGRIWVSTSFIHSITLITITLLCPSIVRITIALIKTIFIATRETIRLVVIVTRICTAIIASIIGG